MQDGNIIETREDRLKLKRENWNLQQLFVVKNLKLVFKEIEIISSPGFAVIRHFVRCLWQYGHSRSYFRTNFRFCHFEMMCCVLLCCFIIYIRQFHLNIISTFATEWKKKEVEDYIVTKVNVHKNNNRKKSNANITGLPDFQHINDYFANKYFT